MPAIITHDTFGREVYGTLYEFIGGTRDEADAFLLGNQGPDPLFYAVVNPRLASAHHLGSIMHNQKPSELLAAFRGSVDSLPSAANARSSSGSDASPPASTHGISYGKTVTAA